MRTTFIRTTLMMCILFALAIPALAQDEVAGITVTKQDWNGFIPVVIGSIILVLLIDAFFIVPIFRKNDRKNEENQA